MVNSLIHALKACYSLAELLNQAAKRAFLGLRIHHAAQALVKNRIVILRYHSVRKEDPAVEPFMPVGITHSPEVFRSQMQYVAKTCHNVPLDDVPAFIGGSKPIQDRSVIITFDDGFRDNYEVAAPILEENDLHGIFYICTSSVEGRPLWIVRLRYWSYAAKATRAQFLDASAHCASLNEPSREEFLAGLEGANSVRDNLTLTWDQARDLVQRGHVIGSHTVNHPNSARISREELVGEMEFSKKTLESKLGTVITHFSYPNPILHPHWDQSTIEVSREAGYKTAVTSTAGTIMEGTNPLSLPREHVPFGLGDFVWNLERAFSGLK